MTLQTQFLMQLQNIGHDEFIVVEKDVGKPH